MQRKYKYHAIFDYSPTFKTYLCIRSNEEGRKGSSLYAFLGDKYNDLKSELYNLIGCNEFRHLYLSGGVKIIKRLEYIEIEYN